MAMKTEKINANIYYSISNYHITSYQYSFLKDTKSEKSERGEAV